MIKFFRHIRKSLLTENKFGKYILYAIGEIALVFIGILMALQFNNWNEEKKTQKNVTTTVNLLKDEINANRKSIDNVKDYHIMIRDTLSKIDLPKREEDIDNTIDFWRGMRTPRLQNAAFQTSIQSGVGREINPILLKTLNGLYTYQDSYNDFTSKSTQIFFNADFSDIKSFGRIMTSIQMTMNDLYWYEKELDEILSYSLHQIDSIYPALK